MTNLTAPRFTNEDAAREHLEALRWPQGPYCPHCGSFGAKRLPPQGRKVTDKHPGGTTRKGVIQCNDCRKQYSVTVGTVFERSKIPLHKWLLANHLLCASKKGVSAHQLHRMLGVTFKTAWFMAHRIREAMVPTGEPPMGSDGGTIEVDETFIGRLKGQSATRSYHHKMKVLSLVERNTGASRSFVIDAVHSREIEPILLANTSREAKLMTDEAPVYRYVAIHFQGHDKVSHSAGEYVRGEAHTNTIEGFFSIFKRGMRGIYQHCGKQHLHRYLAEFDFRYSNRSANGIEDDERADIALLGIAGKRLTYRRANALA